MQAKSSFRFRGYTFTAARQLTGAENLNALRICEHQQRGFAVLPDRESGWDYEAFYKAASKAGAGEIDLFTVKKFPNRLFLPASNYLFILAE
ncbi:MAG: hypothetical protein NVS3B25_18920 [Hymenobacter sp.]